MNVIFRNSTRRLVTPFGALLKNDLRYTGLFWASMTYMTYTIATIPITEQDLADSRMPPPRAACAVLHPLTPRQPTSTRRSSA